MVNTQNNKINIYNVQSIRNLKIEYPDIYFTPEYGIACQYSDNAEWECCIYRDLMFVYLKKKYLDEKNEIYYELLTPYGYSGYYFEKEETFNNFIDKFREIKKTKNYKKEIIRQNPYVMNCANIFQNKYSLMKQKKLYYINLNYKKIEDYFNSCKKNNRRCIKRSIKNKLKCKITNVKTINDNNFIIFKKIYNITMGNLNSNKYYYFNDKYYESLLNKTIYKHIKIAIIYKDDTPIASILFFDFGDYLHYHLGGSLLEYRHLNPNNLLHYKIVEYGIINNKDKYILGGGITNNDHLAQFKSKISNNTLEYIIYT